MEYKLAFRIIEIGYYMFHVLLINSGKVLPAKQSTKLESANKEIAGKSRTVADGEGSLTKHG